MNLDHEGFLAEEGVGAVDGAVDVVQVVGHHFGHSAQVGQVARHRSRHQITHALRHVL